MLITFFFFRFFFLFLAFRLRYVRDIGPSRVSLDPEIN